MRKGSRTLPAAAVHSPALARRGSGPSLAWQHPADAIPILQQEILHVIEGAKRSAYHVGADLAKELRGYAERADRSAEFTAWIREVRADNARRRALQNEFDTARLPR
ncbi:MAG TPA: hypothetical protein VMV92_18230 [Streptosporangiaceae bacterium]|nr:hypothetical protein [Streptosporangiaceae bacterium]